MNAQDQVIARIAAGRWDHLTAEEVASLAARLDAGDPAAQALAAEIGAIRPAPPVEWRAPLPDAREWEAVWQGVRAAGAARSAGPRLLRGFFGRAMAAAAACVMLSASWWLMEVDPAMRPARNLQVNGLEVFGGETAFVVSVDDEGFQVIWVLDENATEGA